MITARSEGSRYTTEFSDGLHHAHADASVAKGGSGSGFGPHSLLEASVATCMSIWLRMHAERQNIPLSSVTTRVALIRNDLAEALFQYAVKLDGPLTPEQREGLLAEAKSCPVSRTLLRNIRFQGVEETCLPSGSEARK